VECALLMKYRLGLEELELSGGLFSCRELVSDASLSPLLVQYIYFTFVKFM